LLQVEEARRADNDAVLSADNRERHRAASISPGQSGLDVFDSLSPDPRDRAPLIEQGIARGRRDQSVDVAVFQRLELDVFSLQS